MKKKLAAILWLFCIFCLGPVYAAPAPEVPLPLEQDPLFEGVHLIKGGSRLDLQGQVSIDMPAGYYFLKGSECATVLERMDYIARGDEAGMAFPADLSWLLLFYYTPAGYVSLPAENVDMDTAHLSRRFQEEACKRGLAPFAIEQWIIAPHFDAARYSLEWAVRAADDGRGNGGFSTYDMRLFGREGVVAATLADDMEPHMVPGLRAFLGKLRFIPGKEYAAYQDGDKTASISLEESVIDAWLKLAEPEEHVTAIPTWGIAATALAGGAGLFFAWKKYKG